MVVEPNVGLEITKGVGIDSIAVNNETAMLSRLPELPAASMTG